MGQILSIIFRWLWGEGDDKKKPSEKLPLISPPSSSPALQPSLGSCRDYTLQTNLRTHPPPPLSSSSSSSSISSSSSFTLSKSSGASRFQPTLQTHHQLNLSSYGLSSKIASSPPAHPKLDGHQQLSSTSCRPSSTTQIHPKLVQTHQPLSSNSFGLSGPSGTSHAQPKIQTPPSLLSSSGSQSGISGASHIQPVIAPLRSVPSRNLGINGASPRNSRSDDALSLLNPAKLKIQVVVDEKEVSARLQQYNRIEEKELTKGVVGRNWRDYRVCEEEDLEEQKLSIEVRWIKHYSSEYKILLVGEGDFSFSASLAVAFVSAANITATSLDSIEFLSTNYKNALSNINKLRSLGAKVMHDVDATKMENVFPFNCMRFDRVVYNFPLAGFFPHESKEVEIWRHRMLVQQFFENAKSMIQINGEIHITHKSNGFFKEWNLEFLASRVGLRLIEEVPFNLKDYPGYRTKYGFGGDNNFDCMPSKTYKFGLKKPTEKASYRFMR